MLDNLLIKEIIAVIAQGLTDRGLAYPILQAYQPTQQGMKREPSIYLFKIGDRRIGFPYRSNKYEDDIMTHTESEWYETTFQISAYAIQNPANITSLTASDIANIVSAILQSDKTLAYLKSKNIGILRITEIRNPNFIDDKDRNEASPNFDFILTHEQVTIDTTSIAQSIEAQIKRI